MIELAIEAARTAGDVLLANLNLEKEVRAKKVRGRDEFDVQWVSEVDRKAEREIINVINERYPEHNILAEESKPIKHGSDYTWVIDSLDGTTQYVRGLPFFSLSIALQHKNEVVLGIVYSPWLDEMFVAEKGKGAFLNSDRINVSDTSSLDRALIASSAFSSYRTAGREEIFERVMSSIPKVRIYGSPAIDLCYVAAGRFDARVTAWTEPWDHSAGCLILEEAGGKVTDWEGNSWRPESRNLLATNGRLHTKLLAFIQSE